MNIFVDTNILIDFVCGRENFVEDADLKGRTVIEMLSSDWKDYEDATQNQTAIIANADCIVTRNKKDFTASTLPVYTIKELFDTIS